MDFIARRGEEFRESFDFKNSQGQSIIMPTGTYKLILEHTPYVREFTEDNRGLRRKQAGLIWIIAADETSDFAYNVLYYTLYVDDTELVRGVLRIQ